MRAGFFTSSGLFILFIASLFFGSSAILVRFATEATAIALTLFRLSIAAIAMTLIGFSRNSLKKLGKRDLLLVGVSGLVLSLHFATFIFAVKETTVANATFLVNTSPVMLAIMSPLIIKERTSSREALAVLVATLGILLVAYAGNGFRQFGLGDVSALLAAFLVSLYALVGRHMRTKGVNTACYTAYVYTAAAFASLAMAAALDPHTLRAYNTQNILAIIGLALLPTTIGHTLYNYALGSVKAVTANLFPLLEPITASIFAIFLFGEVPTPVQVAGYSLIALAVIIVAVSISKASFQSQPPSTNTAARY